MPSSYSIDQNTLIKILLHSAAHPAYSINGLLLGNVQSKGSDAATQSPPGSPKAGLEKVSVEIVDALPLFHTSVTLAPMTEVGLIQGDAYAESRGLRLVGYYQANAHIEDLELGSAGRKIADRIQSNQPQACTLLVDNSKLQDFLQQKESTFFQISTKENNRPWTTVAAAAVRADSSKVAQKFLDHHAEGRHQELVDLDDHLSNIERDWFNSKLLS